MARLVAFVNEEYEQETDDVVALGTFSVQVEDLDDDSQARGEYVYGLRLPDAVDWARARCPRVRVRLAGWDAPQYSAGEVRVDDLPDLPAGLDPVRRRPAGWEFLDRTEADEFIEWDVNVGGGTFELARLLRPETETSWADVRSALLEDARTLTVARVDIEPKVSFSQAGWTAYKHMFIAAVRVRARTVQEAEWAACAMVDDAASAAGVRTKDGGPFGAISMGAYPTGSKAAARNVVWSDEESD